MYLVQRRRVWWAFHDVPPSVRQKIGRPRFRANLKTHDRGLARVRAAIHEARWLARIEHVRRGADAADPDADPDPVAYRVALRNAKSPVERAAILERIQDETAELVM